ncbi:hypothetical protein [Demequina sp.]|uniref:hypothetical protein n=1 Tax=Demequina sp. TaxID=2050685 RepID=UPI003A894103
MRAATVVLLIVLGAGGLYGAVAFLTDPSGAAMGLDAALLPSWLPGDYFVPGLVLASVFGVAPLVTAWFTLRRHADPVRRRRSAMAVSAVGTSLLAWMAVQVLLIGLILPPMQLAFVALGLALVWLGLVAHRSSRQVAS